MEFIHKIWIISFLLNTFLLYCVFDIFFQSPIVHISKLYSSTGTTGTATDNEEPSSSSSSSGVKRVIFIVADGLRADTLFMVDPDGRYNWPYLRELMARQNFMVYGTCDAKVPTESRPGHVALFAGIYEDPSAIFSGWKQNLVSFDTVFDHTKFSVLLGSPDVVNIFGGDSSKNKNMLINSYPSDWQDFLASNSSVLDTWVLDEYKQVLAKKRIPVQSDQVLIFLHLLGIDNTGHATKPNSLEYRANLQLVDQIVRVTEELSTSYFNNDSQTLYVFTSDHGMTDYGSHGGGSRAETETPFIIWGHAALKPTLNNQPLHFNQVDFAAIVAGALNLPFPTNSLGLFQPIWRNQKFLYAALKGNFHQIQELMLTKKLVIEARLIIPFLPFIRDLEIEAKYNKSIQLVESNLELEYVEAVNLLIECCQISLDGVRYYERYDQQLLKGLAIVTFTIWISILGFCCVLTIKSDSDHLWFKNYAIWVALLSVFVVKGLIGWSLWRCLYLLIPFYLARILLSLWNQSTWLETKTIVRLGFFGFLGTEILVTSFYHREVLCLGLLVSIFGVVKIQKLKARFSELWLWLIFIIILGSFPIFPIPTKSNPYFMTLGPCSTLAAIYLLWYTKTLKIPQNNNDSIPLPFILQFIGLTLVPICIHFPELIFTRLLAWISLILLPLPAFLYSEVLFLKLASVFLSIQIPFSLLSLNFESLFMPCLFFVLLGFLKLKLLQDSSGSSNWHTFCNLKFGKLEKVEEQHDKGKLEDVYDRFRTAWLHLFFTYLSFFGIGNIASISSFNPSAVRCFLSVFNPFPMMGLLIIKILGPFLLVASIFHCFTTSSSHSHHQGQGQIGKNFLFVLFLSQGMALHMFNTVTNEGSWLEIGSSISYFVIVQLSTLFLSVLHYVSSGLISNKFSNKLKFY